MIDFGTPNQRVGTSLMVWPWWVHNRVPAVCSSILQPKLAFAQLPHVKFSPWTLGGASWGFKQCCVSPYLLVHSWKIILDMYIYIYYIYIYDNINFILYYIIHIYYHIYNIYYILYILYIIYFKSYIIYLYHILYILYIIYYIYIVYKFAKFGVVYWQIQWTQLTIFMVVRKNASGSNEIPGTPWVIKHPRQTKPMGFGWEFPHWDHRNGVFNMNGG